jgi:transcription elongation factor SPT6
VEKWNAQRAQAVAHALLKVLYPLMEKEMRNKLLLEAKEHVLQVHVVDPCMYMYM